MIDALGNTFGPGSLVAVAVAAGAGAGTIRLGYVVKMPTGPRTYMTIQHTKEPASYERKGSSVQYREHKILCLDNLPFTEPEGWVGLD